MDFLTLDTAVTFLSGLVAGRLLASRGRVIEVVAAPPETCEPGVLESWAERSGQVWADLQENPVASGAVALAAYQLLSWCFKTCCRCRSRRAAIPRYVGARAAARPALSC